MRLGEEVADICLRTPDEPDGAENPGKAEHVLVLEIRSVRIAVDLERDRVSSRADEVGDLVLRARSAVLREADVLPVDPEIVEGIDAVEFHEHAVAFPVARHFKVATVASDGIALGVGRVFLRRLGHHVRRVEGERILYVRVDRRPPTALPRRAHCLPAAWHLYRRPTGDVVFRLFESDRTQRRLLDPVELPFRLGIEANLPRGLPRQNGKRGALVRKGRERGARRLASEAHARKVLPFAAVRR